MPVLRRERHLPAAPPPCLHADQGGAPVKTVCTLCGFTNLVAGLYWHSIEDSKGNVRWGYDRVQCGGCFRRFEPRAEEVLKDDAQGR